MTYRKKLVKGRQIYTAWQEGPYLECDVLVELSHNPKWLSCQLHDSCQSKDNHAHEVTGYTRLLQERTKPEERQKHRRHQTNRDTEQRT